MMIEIRKWEDGARRRGGGEDRRMVNEDGKNGEMDSPFIPSGKRLLVSGIRLF
jgi:hypothetical protein